MKSLSNNNFQFILNKFDLESLLKKLKRTNYLSFYIEVELLNIEKFLIHGFSFSIHPNQTFYIPIKSKTNNINQIKLSEILLAIKPILENKNIKKIGQNLKFFYNIMRKYNIYINNMAFDTMLESYVLNSVSSFKKHDLYSLVDQYLNIKKKKYSVVKYYIKKEEFKKNKYREIKKNQFLYTNKEAQIILSLHHFFWKKIKKNKKIKWIFEKIEMPLIKVLARMENRGILINSEKLLKQSLKINIRIKKIIKETYKKTGIKFNLGSTKELQYILFNKLKLPIIQKTSKGVPSTNEEVLEKLSNMHYLPNIILEYRKLSKLKSTYIDKLPLMINPKTNRIHTSYYQAVTTTGRLSSRNPNLQNIPVKTKEGRKIRKAFIAQKGYKILSADYSQIELRIMAHLSNDEKLIESFKNNQDIHKITASEIFETTLDKVTQEQRNSAKTINFGLIYGMSTFGLYRQLDITHKQAQNYINKYFKKYQGVLEYMTYIKKRASKKGYVETIQGRRLYLPFINSHNKTKRQSSEREAINAPLQGTAADIIKKAMIILDHFFKKNNLHSYMLLQVHDELIFEIKESELIQSKETIKEIMENIIQLNIPLKVDIGIGDNWGETHNI
ncbi:MAG: DNA polymerase I [Arsenophonus sp.]|nr:MAG: DNA polymerase I [Arsenophonus sp.]